MNTFGEIFRLTDFGESHGCYIGGVIDGVPAGFRLNLEAVGRRMLARRPGGRYTSPRRETDEVRFLSGISADGRTLGTPIGFIIPNRDVRSGDYDTLRDACRPGHADYTTLLRYGIRDHRGGGRASARQTACRVVAGAVAAQFLAGAGVHIRGFVSGIGEARMERPYSIFPDHSATDASPVRCPEPEAASRMESVIRDIIGKDSVGGRVSVIIRGVPAGVGRPVYGRMQARLAAAMMTINAARGVEFGQGMDSALRTGEEAIDAFTEAEKGADGVRLFSGTNRCGGMLGGITTGDDICLSIAFKPTPTRPIPTSTFNTRGEPVTLPVAGRHDPCVAIRASAVAEAMACMVIMDELLLHRCSTWS